VCVIDREILDFHDFVMKHWPGGRSGDVSLPFTEYIIGGDDTGDLGERKTERRQRDDTPSLPPPQKVLRGGCFNWNDPIPRVRVSKPCKKEECLKPLVKYGVRSPKFIWAPEYSCTHRQRPRNPRPPPHPRILAHIRWTLLLSQDKHHLFVTPVWNLSKVVFVF
jgi:hypothetical protein